MFHGTARPHTNNSRAMLLSYVEPGLDSRVRGNDKVKQGILSGFLP